MNSDVTVFFLDILPRLPAGILVGIHDIFLPYDYPPQWGERFYSEQYLLAAYLLAEGSHIEIELPCCFVSSKPELKALLAPLYRHPRLVGMQPSGSLFWFSTR